MTTPRIGTPIRLGTAVELCPGEWLHSAISRWAWHVFGVSRAALFDAFGLSSIPHPAITAVGTRLLPEIAANISFATGVPEDQLRAATMERLDERFLHLNGRLDGQFSSTVSKVGPWSWQAGTRYCPDCLHHHAGVFQTHWRSPWAFVCTTHRRILLDACPSCQNEVVEMRGRNSDVFDPSTCRATTSAKGATRRTPCRAKLEETWEHLRVDENSPPMLAQRAILIAERDGTSMELLRLLQAAATGLRGAKAFNEIALLSGIDSTDLFGLFDDEAHVGISAPKSAFAMAGLIGAAFMLTRLDESSAKRIIRQATFARPPANVPRGAGYGPGSSSQLLSRWPGAPASFRAQILRAHDEDLSLSQRILWDTAAAPITLAAHRPRLVNSLKRRACVPEQLWPAWCSRLDVGGTVDAATLARALATAVRMAGENSSWNNGGDGNVAAILRPNMLGTSQQTDRLLAGISELAHTIDEGDTVIIYPKRARLPAAELLTLKQWELLAESINIGPGAYRRHLNARRYLWQRITATGTDLLPQEFLIGRTRDDAKEYTDFWTRMTAELQKALDEYAQAYLHQQGIWEPPTWTPGVVVSVDWPGTEITDVDIDLLHAMLLDGIRIQRRLAETLHISARQVLRAIDALPPSTGKKVTHVDWQTLLPPRLPNVAD